MLNAKKLFKKITAYRLAHLIKIPVSTVYSWKDKIPVWRTSDIETACTAQGIDISDCYEEA
jgi:hypothetical protein